jgi:hypothetical protein
MWVLIVSLYVTLGQVQSKGIIHAAHTSHAQCLKARDQVRETWRLDGYKISPRCVYVAHYSTDNGAYNESHR